jgi:hypothetical protein
VAAKKTKKVLGFKSKGQCFRFFVSGTCVLNSVSENVPMPSANGKAQRDARARDNLDWETHCARFYA